MIVDQQLLDALAALWRIPSPGPDNQLSAPAFTALSELCAQRYGGGRAVFALSNALRSLGLPCGQHFKCTGAWVRFVDGGDETSRSLFTNNDSSALSMAIN
ncbi:hypothetical protein, partial [Halopseudomonas pelagia]|uniref:hypothetical protein n=1 Tax=Halopseudomonas pelagia TaxID=553151 RepID=UPI001F257918